MVALKVLGGGSFRIFAEDSNPAMFGAFRKVLVIIWVQPSSWPDPLPGPTPLGLHIFFLDGPLFPGVF